MIGVLCFALAVLASPFKSKSRLEAENAVLRHQFIVLRRRLHGRVRLTNHDRWFLVQMYRWFPSILTVVTIVRPETLVRWHRAGFRRYWRSKSNSRGGRPRIEMELRTLIHLRRIRISYAAYYDSVRTHRSLHWDAPSFRPIQQIGIIRSNPILGGRHHHYFEFEFSIHTTAN